MKGISRRVRLVRAAGVAAGLAVSAFTVVGLPLSLAVGAWQFGYGLLDGYFPYITDRIPFQLPKVVQESSLLAWEGSRIEAPPSWRWVAETALQLPMSLAGALFILHSVIPMSRRIENATGVRGVRMASDSDAQKTVAALRKMSRGPSARVWVIPGQGVQALALSGPAYGHAIVLSEGIVARLPREMVHWIIAHEYAHILHGDTRSGSLWLLGIRSVHLFDRWRQSAQRIFLALVSALPIFRLISFPCALMISLLNLTGRAGRAAGTTIFLVFDRWASRRMEFAADRYAGVTVGTGPGIALFERLSGDLEPRFGGLFATHPRLVERVVRLVEIEKPAE